MADYDTYTTLGAAAGGLVGVMLVFVIMIMLICITLGILKIIGTITIGLCN